MIRKAKEFPVDGPVSEGECVDCGLRFITDVYRWHGQILCGDCRYMRRHKAPPPRNPTVEDLQTNPIEDRKYDGGFGSFTCGRFRHVEAVSERHVRVLLEIEAEHGD